MQVGSLGWDQLGTLNFKNYKSIRRLENAVQRGTSTITTKRPNPTETWSELQNLNFR